MFTGSCSVTGPMLGVDLESSWQPPPSSLFYKMLELRPREVHDLPTVTQLLRTGILVHVTLDLSSDERGLGALDRG